MSPAAEAPKPQLPPFRRKNQNPPCHPYGPRLEAYKELPVTIGKHPECDFILEHAALPDHHIQIFFSGNQYGIKDQTGKGMVSVNKHAIQPHTFLKPDDIIALPPDGPHFQLLAGGRLAEFNASVTEDTADITCEKTGLRPEVR